MGGRFVLDRIYGGSLPMRVSEGFGRVGFELLSATIDIQGSRFLLTWQYRPTPTSGVANPTMAGSVRISGPYIMLLMDGTNSTDYYAESPAIVLSDGRLRIDNFGWDWQYFGHYWDFKRVP